MKAVEAFNMGCNAALQLKYHGEIVGCPFDSGSNDYKNWKDGYRLTDKNEQEIEECPAPDASDEKKKSSAIGVQPNNGPSQMDVLIQLQKLSEKMYLEMLDQKERTNDLRNGMEYLAQQVKTLVDALAEDQDPDQPITSYLSGKPI